MKLLLFVGAVTCLHLVNSQNQCTRENLDNAEVVEPLLAGSLVSGTQSSPPVVDIVNSTVVCLAVDSTSTTYRFASLVVAYTCAGACLQAGT